MKTSQLNIANTIILVSFLCVALGCQNQADKAELDKFGLPLFVGVTLNY